MEMYSHVHYFYVGGGDLRVTIKIV